MNPKRYSQIERALAILEKSTTVDILKDDQYLLFVYKKTERVASATYILTGLLSDTEPLKWELRESALKLLKTTLSFRERAMSHTEEFVSDAFARLAEVLSLFEIAHIADLISPMNFTVMKKELDTLLGIFEGRGRATNIPVSPPFLSEEFFGVSKGVFTDPTVSHDNYRTSPEKTKETEGDRINTAIEFERVLREGHGGYKGQDSAVKNVLESSNSKDSVFAKQVVVAPKRSLLHNAPSVVREERKDKILSHLRAHRVAMIKDFSSVIVGCSEKTIQRLLSDLVDSGVLKREGERRWSRYSMSLTFKDSRQNSLPS